MGEMKADQSSLFLVLQTITASMVVYLVFMQSKGVGATSQKNEERQRVSVDGDKPRDTAPKEGEKPKRSIRGENIYGHYKQVSASFFVLRSSSSQRSPLLCACLFLRSLVCWAQEAPTTTTSDVANRVNSL